MDTAPFTPKDADDLKRTLRQSVYVEQAAEQLYDVALLIDDSLQMTWDRFPASQKERYRAEIIGSLQRLGILPITEVCK
jgi:hypothetical protein